MTIERDRLAARPGGPGATVGMLSLEELREEAQAGMRWNVVNPFTALVICDVANHDGSPVVESPRQVLVRQFERALDMGYTPYFASELEFYLYKESYAEAHAKGHRDLTPTIPYILDYHILATTMDEEYLGPIRRGMQAAGIPVEFSKGEAWYGQHEVNTRYADAVTSADRHTIYKNGVKEIAFLHGISATFMAKPSEKDIGSSCHIHSSLVGVDGGNSAFVDGDDETDVFRHYLGGMRSRVRELALLVAPSINSYKRYATESWAPTSISWGRDNRTCGFRIVGHGSSRRVECRIPGADVNPYLGYAALLAAGLDGVENGTAPGPELVGNAYAQAEAEPFPSTLREAVGRDMPLLGVCRGMEVLNVALGGTLVPDIDRVDIHRHTPGAFSDHAV